MLIPLKPGELDKLIPAVATSDQFRSALGNPRKILQRIMIAAIGGAITLVFSQVLEGSQFYSIVLIAGVVILLYILWGPIVEAGQKNSQLRRFPSIALFEGEVVEVFTKEKVENRQEQANNRGELELIENRRTWMILEVEDEDGYLGKIAFPMDKKHTIIREGCRIRCLVFSQRRDFSTVSAISDAWLPNQKIWVGEYPYLLRPAFEEFCNLRLR